MSSVYSRYHHKRGASQCQISFFYDRYNFRYELWFAGNAVVGIRIFSKFCSPNVHDFTENLIKNQWFFEQLCSKLMFVDLYRTVGRE